MQNNLITLMQNALEKLVQQQKLPADFKAKIMIEHAKDAAHGEFASNIALLLAKEAKSKPLDIAHNIVTVLDAIKPIYVSKIEVAAPGFINFYLADIAFHDLLREITQQQAQYAHTVIGAGKMAMVEFVSANPTGPLHVGHGRGAAFGDTVANLLETMGYDVHREYYLNDAGRQMHILALSVWLRYLELGGMQVHFPASGYKGDYIVDIAQRLRTENKEKFDRDLNSLCQELPEDENNGGDKEFFVDAMVKRAQTLLGELDYDVIFAATLETMVADIREDLEEFGIVFQEWFRESHLLENSDVLKGIEKLRECGHVYEQDGALWFRATTFGDEKDRVLVRSNGQMTYFASDVGYHLNKYERGFDVIIDVFGADHHGYIGRINAFLQALQLDPAKLQILLVQFAILYRGKQKVSMSTRSGEFVTLRELRDEVGKDASRFFYIMRKNDQHLDFDLELAKAQSADNPVYYIQYAHARICSIFVQLVDKGMDYDSGTAMQHLELLQLEHEKSLLRCLLRYQAVLQSAALNYEPHLLASYLRELANAFHSYYNASQFLVNDAALRSARLYLIVAVKQILFNGLGLLGVSAPEVM